MQSAARINKILELAAEKYKTENPTLMSNKNDKESVSPECSFSDNMPSTSLQMDPVNLTQEPTSNFPPAVHISAACIPEDNKKLINDEPAALFPDHQSSMSFSICRAQIKLLNPILNTGLDCSLQPIQSNLPQKPSLDHLVQISSDLTPSNDKNESVNISNRSSDLSEHAAALSSDNQSRTILNVPQNKLVDPVPNADDTKTRPYLPTQNKDFLVYSPLNVCNVQPSCIDSYSIVYNPEHPTILRLKKKKNYYVSPIHSDESDIDDSDADPDFTGNRSPRTCDINSPSTSIDTDIQNDESDAASTSTEEKTKKGKKRKAKPQEWVVKKTKLFRNSGKAYIRAQNRRNNILKENYVLLVGKNADWVVVKKINQTVREDIFRSYWELADIEKQREFIAAHNDSIKPQYRYSSTQNFRRMNMAFYFDANNKRIRVCKTFFKATLDINDRPIRTTVMKKSDTGFIETDKRGKHGKQPTVNPEIKESVRQFIKAIPRIESHYLRAQTTREYIEGGKSLADLYRDYKEERERHHLPLANAVMFNRMFNGEFNISFYTPKKDQCDLCESYKNADEAGKEKLHNSFSLHLKEKQLSREEKNNDKNSANHTHVAVYDLQAVMPVPKGQISSFYYKSKLNCYNFTISDLHAKNVDCYFWNETEGRRGAVEIGSCILDYLKSLAINQDREDLDVVFYSDNCCGQQKNKYLLAAYFYAISNFKIRSITHTFLIHGHSQNEGDNVHSVIEKQVKKHLRSGPIYVPAQYVALIRTAKNSGPPYKVHEFTYENFYDLKILQEELGKNFNLNTEKTTVKLHDIKIIRVEKDQPRIFYYKTSYGDDSFKMVNILKAKNNRSQVTFKSIQLVQAYDKNLQLSENKKKDLQELVNKNIIPKFYYKSFYKDVFSF